ncbi:unnamed protein product [Mytilus edulis]|uniref:Ig-like domain-containing protein n=1 Tax=Mytilus edulis TaxID=6550 RepID=A0A8S3Q8S1_MYTED|nr:unnamed protein product [Mytilus edulis]
MRSRILEDQNQDQLVLVDVYSTLVSRPYDFLRLSGETVQSFQDLQDLIAPRMVNFQHRAVEPRNRLPKTLIWLRQYPTYPMLSLMFGIGTSTVGDIVNNMWLILLEICVPLVEWPDVNSWRQRIGEWPEMPRVVGSIDGTSHEILVPGNEPQEEFYSAWASKVSLHPHPEWTDWNLWDSCTVDCGFGKRSRNRVCQHCIHGNCIGADNKQCKGNSDEKETCSVISCTGRLYDSLTIGCDLEQNRRNIAWSTTWNFLRDTRNKYEGTTSNPLRILNLQYTDNGKYRCLFWNGQTQNYGIFINLNVYGAPQVTILRQSHFVQIGTTVTFVCNIQSNPPISELWWTDNQAQVITDKLRYNGGHIHNHNLSIISVTDSDSGVYTCNANNTEGTSKATTTLITGSEYSL